MDSVKEILGKKKFSIGQILTFLIGLGVFIFMETDLFKELNDIIKVIIYIALFGSFLVFGVDIFLTKKLALSLRDIIIDNKLTLEEKIMQITDNVCNALVKLGEAWEVFDKTQFEEKPIYPANTQGEWNGTLPEKYKE